MADKGKEDTVDHFSQEQVFWTFCCNFWSSFCCI